MSRAHRWTAALASVLVAAVVLLALGAPQAAAGPRIKGATTRITGGNNDSGGPAISADGRYLTFVSSASDLVPVDTNDDSDVFIWDRSTDTTTRVSVGNGLSLDPAISADGRYVTYQSFASDLVPVDTNATYDVFVWDRIAATTTRVSSGEGVSASPAISADGRYITYSSVVKDDSEIYGHWELFAWDRSTGTATRITHGNGDSRAPAISADGRFITFQSSAANLVPGQTNLGLDVFVWDRNTGETTRVSHAKRSGYSPAISRNGRYITYWRHPDVFVWDASTGTTTRITDGNRVSGSPAISGNGRYVTYRSRASDLVPGDTNGQTDVFVWDRRTRTTTRITDGNRTSKSPAISADGRHVTYWSAASDLVPGDTNGRSDVFVWDRGN